MTHLWHQSRFQHQLFPEEYPFGLQGASLRRTPEGNPFAMAAGFDMPPQLLTASNLPFRGVPHMHPFPPFGPDVHRPGAGADFAFGDPFFPGAPEPHAMASNPYRPLDERAVYEGMMNAGSLEDDMALGKSPGSRLPDFTVNVNFRGEGEENLGLTVPISVQVSGDMTLQDVWHAAETTDVFLRSSGFRLLDYVDLFSHEGNHCTRRALQSHVAEAEADLQNFVFIVDGSQNSRPGDGSRADIAGRKGTSLKSASDERGTGVRRAGQSLRHPPYIFAKGRGFVPNARAGLSEEKPGKGRFWSSSKGGQKGEMRAKDRQRTGSEKSFEKMAGGADSPTKRAHLRRSHSHTDMRDSGVSPHGRDERLPPFEEPVFRGQMEMMGQDMMPQPVYFPGMTGRDQPMDGLPLAWGDVSHFGAPPIGPFEFGRGHELLPWLHEMRSPFRF